MKILIGLFLVLILSSQCYTEYISGNYEINVTCWLDQDQNGETDSTESGLPGVIFYLKSINSDKLIAKQTSDRTGLVTFHTNLAHGTYTLFMDKRTLPTDHSITAGNSEYLITIAEIPAAGNATQPAATSPNRLQFVTGIYSTSAKSSGFAIQNTQAIPGNRLVFIKGSMTFKQGQQPGLWGWDNLVDQANVNPDSDAVLFAFIPTDLPWAIFKFSGDGAHKFDQLTMQRAIASSSQYRNTAVPLEFEILVSTTGLQETDFKSAGQFKFDYFQPAFVEKCFHLQNGFVTAKYVKLVISSGMPVTYSAQPLYMTITEFNLQTDEKQGAIPAIYRESIIQDGYELYANYPNPFQSETTIQYNLVKDNFVELSIFDINGKRIDRLVCEHQTAGMHHAKWNASDKTKGIYFYKISAGNFTASKQMQLQGKSENPGVLKEEQKLYSSGH